MKFSEIGNKLFRRIGAKGTPAIVASIAVGAMATVVNALPITYIFQGIGVGEDAGKTLSGSYTYDPDQFSGKTQSLPGMWDYFPEQGDKLSFQYDLTVDGVHHVGSMTGLYYDVVGGLTQADRPYWEQLHVWSGDNSGPVGNVNVFSLVLNGDTGSLFTNPADPNSVKAFDWAKNDITGGVTIGYAAAPGTCYNFDTFKLTYASVATSPVPEPATFALFGFGLMGLAALRRRTSAESKPAAGS